MRIDIPAGTVFNALTTTGRFERRFGEIYWECRCVCGSLRLMPGSPLRAGQRQSCGCKNPGHVRHGCAPRSGGTRTWRTWRAMLGRCADKNNRWYGSRGITVCARWRDSFDAFLYDMGEASDGYSIDRIDPDGHYEPGNCRWATKNEQGRNMRNQRRVVVAGKRVSIPEAAEMTGLPYSTLIQRLQRLGWSDQRAIETPHLGAHGS